MKELLTNRFALNGLFVKLMLSFLSVILILASFNLFSHLYLSNKVYQEMVRQNELGLAQTVEGYENHFRLTQNMILALIQSDTWTANLGILSHLKDNRRYDIPAEVKADLSTLYTNPFCISTISFFISSRRTMCWRRKALAAQPTCSANIITVKRTRRITGKAKR